MKSQKLSGLQNSSIKMNNEKIIFLRDINYYLKIFVSEFLGL